MNILNRLETDHSKFLTSQIIRYIGDDASRFIKLMDIVFGSDPLLSQRAVWPMSYIGISHPELVEPYFSKLMKKLSETGNHPAIKRNILRLFQEIEVPKKYWGSLIDLSFKMMRSESEPIAVRAFSITVAAEICKHYPELKKEFLMILNDISERPHAPAISVRIKYALKELKSLEPKV